MPASLSKVVSDQWLGCFRQITGRLLLHSIISSYEGCGGRGFNVEDALLKKDHMYYLKQVHYEMYLPRERWSLENLYYTIKPLHLSLLFLFSHLNFLFSLY